MGKLIATLALLLALGVGAAFAVSWWQGRGAVHQLAISEKRADTATVAQGQAQAQTQAAQIVYLADRRDRATDQTHEANREAILSAPGADQPLDPELLRRLRVGLCRYAAYRDDAGCAGLRKPDPALLSPAGPGSGPPH